MVEQDFSRLGSGLIILTISQKRYMAPYASPKNHFSDTNGYTSEDEPFTGEKSHSQGGSM